MIGLHKLVKHIAETYKQEVTMIMAKRKMLFYLKTSMVGFKRRQHKFGYEFEDRQVRLIRNIQTFRASVVIEPIKIKA